MRTLTTKAAWTETREMRQSAVEIKFLIERPRGEAIRRWARARFAPDPHASGADGDGYRTTSLYFDTGNLDVANRRGSYGRSKYRVRRYGDSEVIFFERKLRTSRFLTKRRSIAALAELDLLDESASTGNWSGGWFHRRLLARELRPVCQIAYQRTARVAMTDYGPVRLTIDDEVRTQLVSELAFVADRGRKVFEDQVILELKFCVALPLVFRELVAEFGLAPQAVSKYRLAARCLGLIAADPVNGSAARAAVFAEASPC
jgi:hypothetical protein